ncbi:MAG: hypothetical protein RMK57_06690 [Bryobacterales bacterium]|nr:hypothetical protein [Bryobacteraceae bacterium]MDW8354201.1 hypothetical protein [Bryobacterales bacterium]
MNERVRFRLLENGQHLRIVKLDAEEGAVLEGETDALPRGVTVNFWGANPVTEYRLRRVAQLRGWPAGTFRANMRLDGGDLVLEGKDPEALPSGVLRVWLGIADLELRDMPIHVEVRANAETTVTVHVRPDPRRVELTGPVASFDPEIARVLLDPASVLDGRPCAEWLEAPRVRPRRKACLLNLLAKLRATAAPTPKQPLIRAVQSVFLADVDRIGVRANFEFYNTLVALARDPKKPFYAEGAPAASIHFRVLERAGVDRERFALYSFRQEGRPSLQAVVAVPIEARGADHVFADVDVDLGNPLQDVVGALIHFGEVVAPGRTDHFKLYSKLNRGATKDFLHYRILGG